jgi:hypothetical protein
LTAILKTVIALLNAGCLMDRSFDTALPKHNPVQLDTPALYDAQNNHDDRDNQKNVNESADCVRGNQAQYPEDDQDDCNTFKHVCFSVRGRPLTAI